MPVFFFNKVAGLRPAILLKKKLCHRCFQVIFVKFSRTLFFYRTLVVAAPIYEFDLGNDFDSFCLIIKFTHFLGYFTKKGG